MCGSGAMSWVRNQRIAIRRFSFLGAQSCGPLGLSSRQATRRSPRAHRSTPRGAARRRPGPRWRPGARRPALGSMRACGTSARRRVASTLTRLCPARASSRSSVRSSERSATRTAASTVQPSTKIDMRGQHVPLRIVEQPDAPFDGRAQRALALGQVDRARTQRVEAASQPGEQRSWFQQSGAGGGQLDGERQTIEAPADLHDGERVVVGQREAVAHGLGSIDEQLHGRQRAELLDRRAIRERRHRQWADRILALGPQPEHGAARREDLRGPGSGPGAGRARVRRSRPARGCPARAASAFPRGARPGRPAAADRPRWSRPARQRCAAAPARARRSDASGTNTAPRG